MSWLQRVKQVQICEKSEVRDQVTFQTWGVDGVSGEDFPGVGEETSYEFWDVLFSHEEEVLSVAEDATGELI